MHQPEIIDYKHLIRSLWKYISFWIKRPHFLEKWSLGRRRPLKAKMSKMQSSAYLKVRLWASIWFIVLGLSLQWSFFFNLLLDAPTKSLDSSPQCKSRNSCAKSSFPTICAESQLEIEFRFYLDFVQFLKQHHFTHLGLHNFKMTTKRPANKDVGFFLKCWRRLVWPT